MLAFSVSTASCILSTYLFTLLHAQDLLYVAVSGQQLVWILTGFFDPPPANILGELPRTLTAGTVPILISNSYNGLAYSE